MKEEQLNTLRQQDNALREALRQDEAELPQMPAGLNARLMERVASERRKPRRVVWPWVAAACVAAIMVVLLMPPRESPDTAEQLPTAKLDAQPLPSLQGEGPGVGSVTSTPPQTEILTPPPTPPLQGRGAAAHTTAQKARGTAMRSKALSQSMPDTLVTPTTETGEADVAVVETPPTLQQEKPMTLTERDIPITRPENYKYTPEEIALMKKQANEVYMKWVELELEIAKNNLEQTAQNQ